MARRHPFWHAHLEYIPFDLHQNKAHIRHILYSLSNAHVHAQNTLKKKKSPLTWDTSYHTTLSLSYIKTKHTSGTSCTHSLTHMCTHRIPQKKKSPLTWEAFYHMTLTLSRTCACVHLLTRTPTHLSSRNALYGVAMISRLLTIIGLFCKRDV